MIPSPTRPSANAAVALHPMTKPPIVIWFGVIRVFLCGIENDALRYTTALLSRR